MAASAMVVAAALSLVVFVALADAVTVLFTRDAVRAAADEAVRVGSRSDAPTVDCEARARAVLEGLLGPAVRERVTVTCAADDGDPRAVAARAEVTIVPWLPGFPPWSFVVESASVREVLP